MDKKFTLVMILTFLLIGNALFAMANEKNDFANTIQTFKASDQVKPFFQNSYAYAVFPVIGKAGWVLGGSYGEGRVYRDGEVTGTVSVVEGSVGFQAGGKAFSEIIFFQDKQAYEEFTGGEVEFDATVQAIAITAGAQAQAGTSGEATSVSAGPETTVQTESDYYKGMVVFIHNRGGLMGEASVSGQKFIFTPAGK